MTNIKEKIHESWHPHVAHLFQDKKMQMILDDVLPSAKYYPSEENIFNVFRMPLDRIKVVALGQDPYAKGEAIGYAFAVDEKTPIPVSLNIVRNEIINSKVERDTSVNIDSDRWRTLFHWRQQGVFLLNAALTVEAMNSGSHTGQWMWFTREIVHIISRHNNPIWLLWGSKAQGFRDYIEKKLIFSETFKPQNLNELNMVLECPHPAAEAYDKDTIYKFSGCNHFNLCNKILKAQGKSIINW